MTTAKLKAALMPHVNARIAMGRPLTVKAIAAAIRSKGVKFSNATLRACIKDWKKKPDDLDSAVIVHKGGKATVLPPNVQPKVGGMLKSPDEYRKSARGTRFILTSAQNNTKVHAGFWAALQVFAKSTGAQLMVSRFGYNKAGWSGITKNHKQRGHSQDMWYADEIKPYVQDESIKLAKDLVFCAELDILPTAANPLGGLDNYTGINSGIIPHVKVHMRSMAGLLSGQDQRFLYTTGTCTLRNYIERKAGQVASFHHVYGALYVEIDEDGDWFARQLIASDDGSFWDLDKYYSGKGVVSMTAPYGKVLNLGDIHAEKTDPVAFAGAMDLLRVLQPSKIVVHDLLDFEARNHHNIKDPFFLADQHFNGMNTVEGNFKHAVTMLEEIGRHSDAELLLVRSNHDMAFVRWLKEHSMFDPANARFYHETSAKVYAAIQNGFPEYDVYAETLNEIAMKLSVSTDKWVHIKEDDSYVAYEIELALHGHLGPNGARGTPRGYRQLGRKLNTGHTHSAGIIDGVWTAGVLASLNMGYNKGPSSWSHSHILTHENGKRQMITQRGAKWRAFERMTVG